MDGEHAFSAALTLVMVNVAFPFSQQNLTAMEMALSVLRSMGEKGNEYVQARYALLTNLRSAIGPPHPLFVNSASVPLSAHPFPEPATNNPDNPAGTSTVVAYAPYVPRNVNIEFDESFQPYQDISLNFDMDDDPTFWEEISGNIDIAADTSWIESALRRGGHRTSSN